MSEPQVHKTIVKVQISLVTNDPNPHVLIYNEDRSFEVTAPICNIIKEKMGNSLKKFFHIQIAREVETENGIENLFSLGGEVEWRHW